MYACDYLENGVLNALRAVTFAAPANCYLALYLNDPGENGLGGTEVIYTGYHRMKIDFSAPADSNNGLGYSGEFSEVLGAVAGAAVPADFRDRFSETAQLNVMGTVLGDFPDADCGTRGRSIERYGDKSLKKRKNSQNRSTRRT